MAEAVWPFDMYEANPWRDRHDAKSLRAFMQTTDGHSFTYVEGEVTIRMGAMADHVYVATVTNNGERRRGHASRAMRRITRLADRYGRELMLTVHPMDNKEGALPLGALWRWYGKFGFARTGERVFDPRMTRKPRRWRKWL